MKSKLLMKKNFFLIIVREIRSCTSQIVANVLYRYAMQAICRMALSKSPICFNTVNHRYELPFKTDTNPYS